MEADGGSRGNPGPAGYGAVVWSEDHGTVLAESKQAIGRATNKRFLCFSHPQRLVMDAVQPLPELV